MEFPLEAKVLAKIANCQIRKSYNQYVDPTLEGLLLE
jgi:hypothetical protein